MDADMETEMEVGECSGGLAATTAATACSKRLSAKNTIQTSFGDDYVFQIASSFATRQTALDCIKVVNKDGVGEGSGKVLVKATLKMSLPKRNPPMLGVRRGYIGKDSGMRRPTSLFARAYLESFGGSRGFVSRPRAFLLYRERSAISDIREIWSLVKGRLCEGHT